MAALPRPYVAPGPQRELVHALHDLHHRSGWPSLRELARDAGCSHTTVSHVLSSRRFPSWGVLELLVEAMGGNVEEFRRLWLAASSQSAAVSIGPPIAGRIPELTRVRRHLEGGTGLLVVTGEAGMGKTRLVNTAGSMAGATTFVAIGSCLPLSIDVPLLPIADLLRSAHERDGGRWLTESLADCAPYVAVSVQRLLPELEPNVRGSPAPDDEWSRQRLFGAVAATLQALASRHPLAVLLEDLHWADSATLDLVEHLFSRRVATPVLGTWRIEDPATSERNVQWWRRLQRSPACTTLALHPLSKRETAEQLGLLGGWADPALVDRIHRRSRGQPLFTEQLAAQGEGEPMPQLLADLLDHQLDGIGHEAWNIARALGVADRVLDDGMLTEITGLDEADLTAGLHELADRHLLRPATGHRVELGHPLQAEAVRRRLVAPETVAEHRRIAQALGRSADPSAAEVAEHWQRGEDPAAELEWRIRAALSAAERFALAQAGAQWRRVLDLWPAAEETIGSPPVHKGEAYIAAMDALAHVDAVAAWEVAERAISQVADVGGPDAAEIYQRAADLLAGVGDPAGGLVLVDQAVALHDPTELSVRHVRALHQRARLLEALGRYDEARAVTAVALAACAGIDAPQLFRSLQIEQAYSDTNEGDLDGALGRLAAAARFELTTPDPEGDIDLAVARTDILMIGGKVGEAVVAAGRPGLEAAATWDLETSGTSLLRGNMAAALRLAGEVRRAAELIDPVAVGDQPTRDDLGIQGERATLDMLRGRCPEAVARYDALAALPYSVVANRVDVAKDAAIVDLWCGHPRRAYDRLVSVLREAITTEAAAECGAALAVAMRAAADVADELPDSSRERIELLATLQELLVEPQVDPFEASDTFWARPAHGAAWAAERARLAGRPTLELWVDAARHWDRLGRPHDAAYCRWRGAQVALATGHGTIALRLLGQAAREAREHVPLSSAIAATAQQAPTPPHAAQA